MRTAHVLRDLITTGQITIQTTSTVELYVEKAGKTKALKGTQEPFCRMLKNHGKFETWPVSDPTAVRLVTL